jgi:hypothetical protein
MPSCRGALQCYSHQKSGISGAENVGSNRGLEELEAKIYEGPGEGSAEQFTYGAVADL